MRIRLTLSTIFWIAITLNSGCASNPPELPTWDFEPLDREIAEPIHMPALPELSANDRGEITITLEGAQELELYQVAAEANETIAQANGDAAGELQLSQDQLVVAGKAQREVAVLRQELLDLERSDHRSDNIFHRIIILGLLVGLAL